MNAVVTSTPVKQGRVTAYQSTDGQLFTDRKLYVTHQRNLVAGERLQNLVLAQGGEADLARAVAEFYAKHIAAVREVIESKDISMDGAPAEDGGEGGEGGSEI